MRGGRYLSAEASARGEWKPGGSSVAGADSYATSKQALLASALAFARETPRLRFNAVEPRITPGSGLGRDMSAILGLLFTYVISMLPPFGSLQEHSRALGARHHQDPDERVAGDRRLL